MRSRDSAIRSRDSVKRYGSVDNDRKLMGIMSERFNRVVTPQQKLMWIHDARSSGLTWMAIGAIMGVTAKTQSGLGAVAYLTAQKLEKLYG